MCVLYHSIFQFLPARKVKEKAIKLKKSLTKDIFASTTSENILAMTFRQVVLQQLWNFELEIFSLGRDRDMNNLENPKEVEMSFLRLHYFYGLPVVIFYLMFLICRCHTY